VTDIPWDYWPLYRKVAREAVLSIVPTRDWEDLYDWTTEVALDMIQSGHAAHPQHARWRAIDLYRRWRVSVDPQHLDEEGVRELVDHSPSPEFLAYVRERRGGRPFLPAPKGDFKIATGPAEFVRRWG